MARKKILKGQSKREYRKARWKMICLTPVKIINIFASYAKNHVVLNTMFCFAGIGAALYFEVKHFMPFGDDTNYLLLFMVALASVTFGYAFLSRLWNKVQEVVMFMTEKSCVRYTKARGKVISCTGNSEVGFKERTLLNIDDIIERNRNWRTFTYKGR